MRMNIYRTCAILCCLLTTLFACPGTVAQAYSFSEDFSICDEVGEAYGVDIVRRSHYSHGHGMIVGGQYAIPLAENRHVLATPRLADFRLEAVWNIRTNVAAGLRHGLTIFFRYDREVDAGHVLEVCRMRMTNRLSISIDGKEIAVRKNDLTDLAADQTLCLVVSGEKGTVEVCGLVASFGLPSGPSAGHVALDAIPGSVQCLNLRSVSLMSSEEPVRKPIGRYRLVLDKSQGFAMPVVYDVSLSRYASGETLLEAELSGTVRSRPLEGRIRTGGSEWECVIEKLDTPYVRLLDESGTALFTGNFWNGEKALFDETVGKRHEDPVLAWPRRFSKVFFRFPERFLVAAGYRHAIATPWRFAGQGARETVQTQDGRTVYDGAPLADGAVSYKVTSPADKRLVSRIPADIPQREAALKHAREQHYFYESEPIRFDVSASFRAAVWQADEIVFDVTCTDVYGNSVRSRLGLSEAKVERLPGGVCRMTKEAALDEHLPVGVYKLVVNGEKTVFEVLPDDPNGPCPPLASKLPQFVSMPSEIKFLEQNAFDPWGEVGGIAHYYSVDNRYPAVGNALEIWRLLPIYRRSWWCWNWNRNSDRTDMRSAYNQDLIRHADVFGGADERYAWDGRYELGVVGYYRGFQLKLLREFLKERGLQDAVPTPEPFTYEAFRTLFATCWREWVDWARPRIDATVQAFNDYLLSVNPSVGKGTYGPYAVYVAHYKTAYALTFGGYPMVDDPRLRENGSFWLFEDYHHSCDYPLYRPALFVATYDLHFGRVSRRIFPEIYYSGWIRCEDGAVYKAHPMSKTTLAACHQRRVAYQYAYGTPHYRNGAYGFWKDYGFHAREPERESMEEFVHAWGNLVRNEPVAAPRAPFVIHDIPALRRNGEYMDEECNPCFPRANGTRRLLADVCNSAEEDVAYAYEQAVVNGYTTPVVTTFGEIGSLDADKAEFVILPPIVADTPSAVLSGIRALHARGVNLLAFEQVVGIEDLFGVRRADERRIGHLTGETFSHALAKARYAAEGGEVALSAAEKPGAPFDIPLVVRRKTATGRTVFVNAPPAAIRRASYREGIHWGQDSLCEGLKAAMTDAYAFLSEKPSVKSEHGLVSSARTASGDLIVVVSDEPKTYKDRTVYPVPMRFTVRVPGVGDSVVEADTDYSVVTKTRDEITLRLRMERDNAYFFRFQMKGGR